MITARNFPGQFFVLDHLAKPDYSEEGYRQWSAAIKEISKRTNVFCKISGMVTEHTPEDMAENELIIDAYLPHLELVLEQFTPERLMFGSDWPVCTLAATYDEVYDIASHFIQKLDSHEQDLVMGETAARFYGISGA